MNSFSSANHLWGRKTIILGATGNPQRSCLILVLQLWERMSAKHYLRPLKLTSFKPLFCFVCLFKNLPIFKSVTIRKSLMNTSARITYIMWALACASQCHNTRSQIFYTSAYWDFSMKCSRVNNECSERLQASLHCWDKGASFPRKHSIWVY